MATIEELQQQVAALSAQVAAITAPPTDYYTSQYDGEEIDAAVTAALTPDTVPTDGSQKLVTSGAVKGSLAVLAPLTMLPNRNLLDNWDFRNPVNQRGKTSYTSGYAIDRWLLTGTVTLTANNGNITVSGGSGGGSLRQIIETELEQAIYTLSFNVSAVSGSANLVLQKNGGDYDTPVTKPLSVGITSGSGTPNASAQHIAIVDLGANASVDLVSAKLELGSVSTLANDPPADYGTDLAKCKRYFNLWASEAARTAALLEVGAMRTTPVLSTVDVGGVTYYVALADL